MEKNSDRTQVFRAAKGHRNVVLNYRHCAEREFGPYGRGFHEAARSLADAFLRKRGGFSDLEGLPIVYLYRHALELHLKGVVLAGQRLMRLNGDGLPEKELRNVLGRHEMSKGLLPHVHKIFCYVNWPDPIDHGPIKTFADIRSVVIDLERVDPQSVAFRYPTKKKGGASLAHHFGFSVQHFVSVMDPLIELLGNSVSALEEYWDNACEAMAEEM